jgi:membrane protease YdiL (CAAX protease family)
MAAPPEPASAGPALDGRLALSALIAIPLLTGLALGLSVAFGGLTAWVATLLAYWAVLGGSLLAWADRDWLLEWLFARSPGRLVSILLAVPVIALGAMTMRLLGQNPLAPHLILAVAIAAVINATLEELFWRGALIPEPTPRSAALALALFVLAHVIWLGVLGLDFGGPPVAALAGALVLGGVWTASRLLSGTVGAGLLSHAGFNLFAFTQVLALNA